MSHAVTFSGGTDPDAGPACGHGRDRLVDELRAVALLALDQLDPLLARLRRAAPAVDGAGPCPLCTVLAAVRAERPDAARRLAEHATGLVDALRDALSPPEPGPAPPPPPSRPVQHIPVKRFGHEPGGARC